MQPLGNRKPQFPHPPGGGTFVDAGGNPVGTITGERERERESWVGNYVRYVASVRQQLTSGTPTDEQFDLLLQPAYQAHRVRVRMTRSLGF